MDAKLIDGGKTSKGEPVGIESRRASPRVTRRFKSCRDNSRMQMNAWSRERLAWRERKRKA